MPRQFLLVTDADAKIENAAALAEEMKSKNIRLHLLAIGSGSGLAALKQIVDATGGTLIAPSDVKIWSAGLQDLSRAAMPDRVELSALNIHFLSPLQLADASARPWNRTWLKASATPLAQAKGDSPQSPVATWKVGAGEVIAAAFSPTAAQATAIADAIARPPRDPRLKVAWETGAQLRVTIDALDGSKYLNDLPLTLELLDADSAPVVYPIRQTGPGWYELSLPAPRTPTFASVRMGNRLIDQTAVAGRYPTEFDAVGNDHDAMHELTRRTGGAVVDVLQNKPIDFHWPRRDVPIASWLAAAGAIFMAMGLAWWRMH